MGKLIVFEGVEGCGKTSQIQSTQEWLQSLGIPVTVTREPGGTPLGVHLRRLLLQVGNSPIADRTELLLYAADRSQHVDQELIPNLQKGNIILCDRFTDSTIAYQGYGRGLDMTLINQLNAIATAGLQSDITLWLDVDVQIGLTRKHNDQNSDGQRPAKGDGAERPLRDRIEQETLAFHRRVQQGYTQLHASHPQRIIRIDASLGKEAVQQQIQTILTQRLKAWGYLK